MQAVRASDIHNEVVMQMSSVRYVYRNIIKQDMASAIYSTAY